MLSDGGDADEAEPVLRYERANIDLCAPPGGERRGTSAPELADDGPRATAVCTHDHWLATGLSDGRILIFEVSGGREPVREVRAHGSAVTGLSTDLRGAFLASCGADGSACVTAVRGGPPAEGGGGAAAAGGGGGDELRLVAKDSFRCVAIDPQFGNRRERLVLVGGEAGQLLLERRGWFTSRREVLHEGEGAISAVAWRARGASTLVAWANEKGVKVMDALTGERISFIERPASSLHPDAAGRPPALRWDSSLDGFVLSSGPEDRGPPAAGAPPSANSNGGGSPLGGNGGPARGLASPCLLVGWGDTVMKVDIRGNAGDATPLPRRDPRAAPASARSVGAPLPHLERSASASASASARRSLSLAPESPGPGAAPPAREPMIAGVRYAEISLVMEVACVVCGLGPFDPRSLLVLGYVPPARVGPWANGEEEKIPSGGGAAPEPPERATPGGSATRGEGRIPGPEGASPAPGSANGAAPGIAAPPAGGPQQPELLLLDVLTGQTISCDALPLRGWRSADARELSLLVHFRRRNRRRGSASQASAAVAAPPRDRRSGVWLHGAGVGWSYGGGAPPRIVVSNFRDVVLASLRGADDKVDWALSRGRLGAAVEVARANVRLLKRHSVGSLVSRMLEQKLDGGDFSGAAALLPRLLGDDAAQWERYAYAFAKRGRLGAIAAIVPTGRGGSVLLPRFLYEMVLDTLLDGDPEALVDTLRRWGSRAAEPPKGGPLFDAAALLAQVELRLKPLSASGADPRRAAAARAALTAAKAELHMELRQYDRALHAYLDLQKGAGGGISNAPRAGEGGGSAGSKTASAGAAARCAEEVFSLIVEHDLWAQCAGRVPELVRLDRDRAGRLLARHMASLPPSDVVAQLGKDEAALHWYLDTLFTLQLEAYNTQQYAHLHEMQVRLYASFAPPPLPEDPDPDPDAEGPSAAAPAPPPESDLLRFLRVSSFAPLELALRCCTERSPPLYVEAVYVLQRMGNFRGAMNMLLRHVGSVRRAIDLIEATGGAAGEGRGDPELWKELVDHCLRHPSALAQLLQRAGRHSVSAAAIVRSVPPGTEVPQLRRRLRLLFADVRFKRDLTRDAARVLTADTAAAAHGHHRAARRARRFAPAAACAACGRALCAEAAPEPAGGRRRASRRSARAALRMAEALLDAEDWDKDSAEDWGQDSPAAPGGAAPGGAGAGARVKMFMCGHGFHEACLEGDRCPLCAKAPNG